MRRIAVLALLLAGCAPGVRPGPPPGLALDAGGIQPAGTALRIDFGRAQAGTVEAVSRLLGTPPAEIATNADCGAGPVTAARWTLGLTLNFQDGTFLGWVSDAGGPGTTAGLAPGMPRAALTAATFAETPLGPEFEADEVFGLLEGEKVARLWAGVTCFFR